MQYPATPTVTPVDQIDPEECEGDCTEAEYADDAGAQPSNAPPAPTLALPGSTFVPLHVEQREDRIVFYGWAGANVTEFSSAISRQLDGTPMRKTSPSL